MAHAVGVGPGSAQELVALGVLGSVPPLPGYSQPLQPAHGGSTLMAALGCFLGPLA